jgi:A/G-specific adenine glycosylase
MNKDVLPRFPCPSNRNNLTTSIRAAILGFSIYFFSALFAFSRGHYKIPTMPRVRDNSEIKIQNSKIAALVPRLLSWFSQRARDLPWRRTRDPYAIWVSEIVISDTYTR